MNKETKKAWENLQSECLKCQACKLSKTRTNVVFGAGNTETRIVFIGEGPGKQEDLKSQPFVGKSGKLLDKMLNEVGYDRNKNIYIANIVKCRPPNNRDPFPEEQKACFAWLVNQIKLLDPKVIVCLGKIASSAIIKRDFMVTKEHGIFFKKGKRVFMGTFHPAVLLRNPSYKKPAMQDLVRLKEKVARMGTPSLCES
ncbi:MAG: uracil-DNA glycosylase [Oscillospiraceae bacterium]|jgi:DNA polymerase|nr:uracil-DNA glycosylase [Oscillospiraceae bacterium]